MMLRSLIGLAFAFPFALTIAYASSDALSQARAAFDGADYPAAERHYREALSENPRSPEVWNALGVTLNREQRFDEAALCFRSALELSPSVKGLHLNLGIALFRAGKLEDAARELTPLSDLEQARELLALSFAGLGQYDGALPLLEGLAVQSIDPTIHLALAKSYEALGRKSEVEQVILHMFEVVPESAPLHIALGDAYGASNLEKALAEYQKAIDLEPALAGVHLRMARLLWKVRRFEEAEPHLQAELKCDPGNVDSKYYLGTIHLYRDDARNAIPFLREFAQGRSTEKNGFFELGRALLKEKLTSEAISAFERAAALDSRDANVHYQLGQAYRAAGRTADAQREFASSERLRTAKLDEYNKQFQSDAKKITNGEQEK